MSVWPDAGLAVWSELTRFPGRVAFILDDASGMLSSRMADLTGSTPLDVGKTLTEHRTVPNEQSVVEALAGHAVLAKTEILFDQVLRLDPVRLFLRLARESPPVAVVWPGDIVDGALRYPPTAKSGQFSDYRAPGCLILRATETVFDDDAPFRVERV